jgi:manganese efflux pump family protein
MVALVLVAISLGVSNLAAAIGIGASGLSAAARLRVLLTFGLFEGGMPIVGLLIGHGLAAWTGRQAKWVGAALLVVVGSYAIFTWVQARRRSQVSSPRTGASSGSAWLKVTVSGFALSLDNLVAGFALGGYQVSLVVGALVFAVVSVVMSLAGLELGARIGNWTAESGELIGGVVLVGVGVAIGLGVLG